ncbi:flagellar hook-associated protein FlgK [Gemmatimonadetes bacterium T265]|nr:flagellar hook-associated protein FlgK [Gemmatimonadetes bacterium T265]
MSLNSVLGTARSALTAQQVVISTVGNNIANAQTPGYSRQTVDLAASTPIEFTYGAVGSGVTVAGITRSRDQLLDTSVRQETGSESAATESQSLLSSVQDVLGEPSDTGLASAMDAFWSGWSDLAAQPASGAAKAVVVQRGAAAATMLNQFDSRLADLRTQTTTALDNSLAGANTLAKQIADLNGRIVSSEAGGQQANDLRDARDNAVDDLAKLGAVRTFTKADGSMQVTFGSYTLVDGIDARQLQRTTDANGKVALAFADQPNHALAPSGGSTQAMADFLNGGAQSVQDQLDALANTLAAAVNQVVAQGHDASGASAGPFFVSKLDSTFTPTADPFATPPSAGTVTARTISVNTSLVADATALPTSSSVQQPSNNDLALALAGLRTASTSSVGGVTVSFTVPDRSRPATATGGTTTPARAASTGATTFADFYNATVTGLGVQVKAATDDAQVHTTLAGQARTRRQSVDGVNTDEELTNLMQAQQAYAAAAKIVSTVDDMMKTLVEMV